MFPRTLPIEMDEPPVVSMEDKLTALFTSFQATPHANQLMMQTNIENMQRQQNSFQSVVTKEIQTISNNIASQIENIATNQQSTLAAISVNKNELATVKTAVSDLESPVICSGR